MEHNRNIVKGYFESDVCGAPFEASQGSDAPQGERECEVALISPHAEVRALASLEAYATRSDLQLPAAALRQNLDQPPIACNQRFLLRPGPTLDFPFSVNRIHHAVEILRINNLYRAT